MGKEQVYFKDSKEKAITKQDRQEDRHQKSLKGKANLKVAKKNISKKEADKIKRLKLNRRIQRIQELRKQNQEKDVLKPYTEGKLSKLTIQEKREHLLKQINEQKKQNKRQPGNNEKIDESDWEDVDEHEKEVFATTGYFDIPDSEAHISKADQIMLEKMKTNQQSNQIQENNNGERTLADIIMQKMMSGDYVDGDKHDKKSNYDSNDIKNNPTLDPKVTQAYKKVGVVMRSYKSGKLPKAFKIIPQTQNWEELLFLTNPDSWSAHSYYQATKMFTSQLNGKMVQRFYNIILLPGVQKNIEIYKKLNYHLYMAVKKAMFKTAPFFKGFLLPLSEVATTREAIIIGSILQKMSINALDVAAALMKMTSQEYRLGNGYFIKVLVSKRYTLPTVVLEALVNYFCKTGMQNRFNDEEDNDEMEDEKEQYQDELPEEMPVMWHQTVLALVQCYKQYFSPKQRKKINALIKIQNHYAITPEIKRELAHM